MELSLGLGSGFDMYDKQRKDEKHEIDDGTQIMTVTVKGRVIETISCKQSAIFFSNLANMSHIRQNHPTFLLQNDAMGQKLEIGNLELILFH